MDESEALGLLNDRERRVIELRYGMENTMPHTLQETAKVMSKEEDWQITRARVRIIENRAYAKIGRMVFLEMMDA